MGLGRRFRVLFVAVVVAVLAGGVTAIRSEAASPGFTWQASEPYGTFVGTPGDDLLILSVNNSHWNHNRFAAGDAGFDSAEDFDPATAGVQPRKLDQPINTRLGDGNDTLRFVGNIPNGEILQGALAGDGTDVLDCSELVILSGGSPRGIAMGSGGHFTTQWQAFERFVGTAFNDDLTLDVYGSNPNLALVEAGPGDDEVTGTDRAETIDLGPGANKVQAMGGNDTIIVQAPFSPSSVNPFDGGEGTDLLKVVGTQEADDIGVITDYTNAYPRITDAAAPEGGVKPQRIEALDIDLRGGNDSLYAEAVEPAMAVHGGSGTDELLFNAMRYQLTQGATHVAAKGLGTVTHDGIENRDVFNDWFIATGTAGGGAPHVRAFDAVGGALASFYAYGENFTGGVNVATGDLNGDSVDEIITATGPGGGPHIRVFHRDGSDTGIGFYAYGAGFAGGVKVATGDLDGDGVDEIITVPASNGGPHVRVWTGDGQLLTEFFAARFASTGLTVGSMGTASAYDLIVIGSGPNTPSLLSVFDADGSMTSSPVQPFGQFEGGVSVAGFEPGSAGGGGYRNGIVVTAGPGGGPHVRTYRQSGIGAALEPLSSFYAFDPRFTGGVVAGAGLEQARTAGNLIVGAGRGATPHVHGLSLTGESRPPSFFAYLENFQGGVTVAVSGARPSGYFSS